jgi:hypothetical protein
MKSFSMVPFLAVYLMMLWYTGTAAVVVSAQERATSWATG